MRAWWMYATTMMMTMIITWWLWSWWWWSYDNDNRKWMNGNDHMAMMRNDHDCAGMLWRPLREDDYGNDRQWWGWRQSVLLCLRRRHVLQHVLYTLHYCDTQCRHCHLTKVRGLGRGPRTECDDATSLTFIWAEGRERCVSPQSTSGTYRRPRQRLREGLSPPVHWQCL